MKSLHCRRIDTKKLVCLIIKSKVLESSLFPYIILVCSKFRQMALLFAL